MAAAAGQQRGSWPLTKGVSHQGHRNAACEERRGGGVGCCASPTVGVAAAAGTQAAQQMLLHTGRSSRHAALLSALCRLLSHPLFPQTSPLQT